MEKLLERADAGCRRMERWTRDGQPDGGQGAMARRGLGLEHAVVGNQMAGGGDGRRRVAQGSPMPSSRRALLTWNGEAAEASPGEEAGSHLLLM